MWYHEDLKSLYASLNSQKNGLTSEQAEKYLTKYGRNELSETKKKGF